MDIDKGYLERAIKLIGDEINIKISSCNISSGENHITLYQGSFYILIKEYQYTIFYTYKDSIYTTKSSMFYNQKKANELYYELLDIVTR